jgi:hypothetical protein
MRFGLVLRRTALVALSAASLASCGTQEATPNLGTVEFAPIGWTLTLPANAGLVQVFDLVRVTVRTPTGQPMTKVNVQIQAATLCEGFVDPATCTVLNPTGLPVTFETDDFGGVDVTFSYFLTGGDSGEVSVIQAWSGTAYNRANVEVECVDAGGVTCP